MYHVFLMELGPKQQTCAIIHNYGFDNPWLLKHSSVISNFYHSSWIIFTSKTNSDVVDRYISRGFNVLVLQKSPQSIFALVKLILNSKPDLFSHGLRPTQISFLFGFLFNLRLIVFQHYSPRILNFGYRFRNRITKALNFKLLKSAIRRSALVFVFSREVFHELMEFGLDSRKLILTPLGIASNHTIVRSEYVSTKQHFKIIIVGRLSVEKNLFLALDVLSKLKSFGVSFSARFFGSGPLHLSLRNYAYASELGEEVSFEGWNPNLHEIYADSDLLLHTSWTEGYGQVFIEALEKGLKIFSTNVGVVQDLSDYKIELVHIFNAHQDTTEIAKSLAIFLGQDSMSYEGVAEFLALHSFSRMQNILETELEKFFKIDE